MNIGVKIQDTDLAEINRGTVHERLNGGNARTFTKAEGLPKFIRCDADGTLVTTDWQSSPASVTYNLVKGEILNFIPQTISNTSTANIIIVW